MRNLKAGAAKVCIDPDKDMFPMTTHFGVCEAQHDSCYCRAIAIENGEKHFLIISFELSDMPEIPDFRKKISDRVGYSEDEIMLCLTHDHSSPNDSKINANEEERLLGERYKQVELEKAIEAGQRAVHAMRPAKYSYGKGESYINVNRDHRTRSGKWVEAPDFRGETDKTLTVIWIEDWNGKLIAAILNHATHATCTLWQRDFDEKTKLSGDFPGVTCRILESCFGDGAVVMWTSGAAGNQSPFFSGSLLLENSDGCVKTVTYPDGSAYLQMEQIGRQHAMDALALLERRSELREKMWIFHKRKDILLPAQKRTGNIGEDGWPEMEDDLEHPVRTSIELLVLEDIAVVGIGAELYVQLGKRIKEVSPYNKTMVVTHTDYHVGYIMDRSSVMIKRQQAFGRIKPGGSDRLLVENVMELFDESLRQKENAG